MRVFVLFFLFYISVEASGQVISTIAGGGVGGDGTQATAAAINNPGFLAFDKFGNLFFTESAGNRIRKINTSGIISTVAGSGTPGFGGDGGPAKFAVLNQPAGIVVDTVGNIFFVDGANHRIRKIDASTGFISTIVGGPSAGFTGDGGSAHLAKLYQPGGLWFDKNGDLYVCDDGNLRLRKIDKNGVISTVAGNGLSGRGGDGTLATASRCYPYDGIAKDGNGNLYFTEWTWGVIRKINALGIISTIAGDTSGFLYNGDNMPASNARINPFFILINDQNEIIISDTYNNRIRKIDKTGIISTIAGTGIVGSNGDGGLAVLANIHHPSGMAFDSCGNLFFTQANTPRIRKIAFNPDCVPMAVKEDVTDKTNGVTLLPNPTAGVVTLTTVAPVHTVAIYNLLGQIVLQQSGSGKQQQQIDVSTLPPGVYIVRVNDVWTVRLVKE